jgi:gliding motility-associated-like protein
MTKKLLLFFTLLCSAVTANAQLQLQTLTIQQYVQDVLLGSGVAATNISFTGCPQQIGYITGGNSIGLSIDGGIALSSEAVATIVDPASTAFLDGTCEVSGDAALLSIANSVPALIGQTFSVGSVNDVAILEFDFVPTGDTLRFNYIFGSDEYLTWVNSSYNDIFAFLLSGPGLTGPYASPAGFPGGAVNIAQLPNTTPPLPITISSVNNVLNSSYYIDNQPNVGIYLNGYTVTLEAWSLVQCGETYHIKLAIADGSDTSLESAVILEEGSFSSNAVVDVNLSLNAGGPNEETLFEDCGEATLTFTRPEISDLSIQDMCIITWTGTAVNGVDFTFMPDTVFFPPGIASVSFTIDAFSDGLTEGIETVHMDILNLAACNGSGLVSNFDFFVADVPDPIVVTGYPQDLCLGMSTTLEPTITGGYGNYVYAWSTSETTSTIDVSPINSTTYYLTVTDTCGWPGGNTDFPVNILVFPQLVTSIDNGDITIGCNESVNITATTTGGDGAYTYLWTDENGANLFGWGNSLFYGSWSGAGTVNVEVTDGCGLVATDQIQVALNIPPLIIDIPDTINAPCLSYFTITANATGGDGFYSYSWYTNNVYEWDEWDNIYDNTGIVSEALILVEVSDGCGQFTSASTVVTVEAPPLAVTLPASFTGNCITPFTIQPTVTGGGGTMTYAWDNNGTPAATSVNYTLTPGTSTTIGLTVTDGCGSTANAAVPITITNPPVFIDLGNDITAGCLDNTLITPTISGGSGANNFDWTVDNTVVGNGTTYSIVTAVDEQVIASITDACNQTDSDTLMILIPNPPLNLVASLDTAVCVLGTAMLSAQASGGGGGFTYTWTNNSNGTTATYSDLTSPSTYTVTASDMCGQFISEDVFVDVIPVDAQFTADNSSGYTYDFINIDTPPCVNCTYEWIFPSGEVATTPSVTYTFDGFGESTVYYNVTNSIGCTASNSFTITFPPLLYIPNTFTPNNDGLNDVFMVEASSVFTYEIRIFDRWGDQVYYSTNVQDAWTGDRRGNNGTYCPNDIYNYVAKIKGFNGEAQEYQGTITLVR